MAEESYSFAQARLRLEEIVSQVRKKDLSLEASLDLLEEGVRLANQCTELIDHADWEAAGGPQGDSEEPDAGQDAASSEQESDASLSGDATADDGEPETLSEAG